MKELLNNRQWLYQKYISQGFNTSQIAGILGYKCGATVSSALKKHGIKIRDNIQVKKFQSKKSHKYPMLNDYNWLYDQYITQQKSTLQIGQQIQAKDGNSVRQALIRHGIHVRGKRQAQVFKREQPKLLLNMPVIQGSLLGDACLTKSALKSKQACPSFHKKNKNMDHVQLVIKSIYPQDYQDYYSQCDNYLDGKNYPGYQLRTLSHEQFKSLHEKWYPESNGYKKMVPRDLILTPEHVLHWFMDDGWSHWRNRTNEYKKKIKEF